jgi:MoaA/NifB/PqqE/SkfB family radical SAM enzyme
VAELDTVYLHVTAKCPWSCVYCYLNGVCSGSGELTAEQWKQVHGKLMEDRPRKLVITGGEPMARPDILRLLEEFRKECSSETTETVLDTSGYGIDSDVAEKLAEVVDRVRLSMDGPCEVNDASRGEGSFNVAAGALRRLIEAGLQPEIGATVTTLNLHALSDFAEEAVAMGCRNISFCRVRPIGRAEARRELMPSRESFSLAVEAAARRLGLEENPFEPLDPPCTGCGVGSFLSVLPDGSVYPCHVLHLKEFRLGNLAEDPLETIMAPGAMLQRLSRVDLNRLNARFAPAAENGPHSCLGQLYRDHIRGEGGQYLYC